MRWMSSVSGESSWTLDYQHRVENGTGEQEFARVLDVSVVPGTVQVTTSNLLDWGRLKRKKKP